MPRLTIALAATASLLLAGAAAAETVTYRATMNGASEVPPKQTQATGTVDATLDTSTRKLDWTATWQNLSGPATAAHFHGPAAPGVNAGVVVPWSQNPTSPDRGSVTLTPEQAKELQDGKWYANVHTAQNPAGEIRGQLDRAQ